MKVNSLHKSKFVYNVSVIGGAFVTQLTLGLTVTDVSTEQVVSKSKNLKSEINVLTSAIRHRHGKNLFGAFRRVTPFLLWNM